MTSFHVAQFKVIFCRWNGEEFPISYCFDAENRNAATRRTEMLVPPYRAAVAKILDNSIVFKRVPLAA